MLIIKIDDIKIKEIVEKLSECNWSDSQSPDPNLALDFVMANINMYYNAILPEKFVKIKTVENRRKPWLTIGILKYIKQKNRLYTNFLSKRDPAAKQKYSKYKNLLQKVIWQAEKLLF